MIKREMDAENLEKILKSTVRDIATDYYDESLFLETIKPYTNCMEDELIINPQNNIFDDYQYGYAFFKSNTDNPKEITRILSKLDFSDKYHIIFTVNSINIKRTLEKDIIIKEIRSQLKKDNERINYCNINASNFIITFYNPKSKGKYPISITKRTDSIMNDNPEVVAGYIFTAKLFDIVNIYNTIGDSLFDYNVRYKIRDELNVDEEILETLKNNPKMFWFYNNGITIVIKDKNFMIENPKKIVLSNEGDKFISVINGAQTISAASQYFNDCDSNDSAISDAMVVLRVINLKSTEQSQEEINKISIALNRQKSINEEDISFTFEFVDKINKIACEFDDENRAFELYKRGGSSYCSNNYQLVEFVKLVKCYLAQKPGIARNSSKRLLKSVYDPEAKTYIFKDDEIYKNIENTEDFLKYYSPTNFANSLLKLYSKVAKTHNDSTEMEKNIYSYATWYFVAKAIYTLNNGDDDFTDFNYDLNVIDDEKANTIVETFVEDFLSLIHEEKLDSNNFKNEALYDRIKPIGNMPNFEELLKSSLQ